MAVRKVRLKESWVCERAGLEPVGAGIVQTLAIQGTYREKIVSLGDAFKNFTNLRSLDLSRNTIISLQGIEYLKALCSLNLYYNDIESLDEIKHLKSLAQLKKLDLRLNPVTRQDSDYRIFVINILGALETLDERPVRESERKTAISKFCPKSQETLEGEPGSSRNSSPPRSYLYGESRGAKAHLDFGASNMTDMGKGKSQDLHSKDYTKGSSPKKYLSEDPQSYLQPQPDFEDEYRPLPLPSPTRSALRSPSARSKEGHRVTFSESTISEFCPKQEDLSAPMTNKDNICSAKNPGFNYPDKLETALSFRNTYLTSTPLKKDAAGSERMRPSSLEVNENFRSGDINDIRQGSETRDRLKPSHISDESSRERLLRISTDLYATTHLVDPSTSSSSFSALRKNLSDISKAYTLPSKPTIANAPLTTKTTEPSRDYKIAWSPEKTSTTPLTAVGMRRSNSLNSLSSSDHYSGQHKEDLLNGNELKKRESLPSSSENSSISDVLQQLMDLVDRYWNGSGSLLYNQRFIIPARDLLTKLKTSDTAKQMSPISDQLRGSRNSHGPLEEGDSMESLKLKLVKAMEENHFLRSKVYKIENQVGHKEGGGDKPPPQGSPVLQ